MPAGIESGIVKAKSFACTITTFGDALELDALAAPVAASLAADADAPAGFALSLVDALLSDDEHAATSVAAAMAVSVVRLRRMMNPPTWGHG
jgi:hypothetical protein